MSSRSSNSAFTASAGMSRALPSRDRLLRVRLPRVLLVVTVLAVYGTAPAENADKGKTSTKTKPTPVESMARIADSLPKSVLKCWQEGRLIFESDGVTLPDVVTGAPPAMKGANGRSLQLLDLRQAVCILERTNG